VVGVVLPNSCLSTRVGSGSIDVCAIPVREVPKLDCNDGPKSFCAESVTSLEEEYSKISKNCPRSINNFRLWRIGTSLATKVVDTVSPNC
jgi:hypothetical protein